MGQFLESIEKTRVSLPPMDAAKLKYVAVVTMLIDHAACVFLERTQTADGRYLMDVLAGGALLDRILRAVGRQAFPVFCFFLVEGFFYTRSRVRYLIRLAVFALLSQEPFRQCIFPRSDQLHANVMCTLLLGLLAIWCIDALGTVFLEDPPGNGVHAEPGYTDGHGAPAGAENNPDIREAAGPAGKEEKSVLARVFCELPGGKAAESLLRRGIFLLAAAGTVYGFCRLGILVRTDYSYGGIVLIILLYLLRDYRICALFFSWLWLGWYNQFEIYAAPAFLLLACYNGKRGRQQKYFFYAFYPAHLALLWGLRVLLFP